MKLKFMFDAEADPVDRITPHYQDHAAELLYQSYGQEVVSVAILFMCRDASIEFKRRVQFRRAKA